MADGLAVGTALDMDGIEPSSVGPTRRCADGLAMPTATFLPSPPFLPTVVVCADGHFAWPDGVLARRRSADGHRRHRDVPTASLFLPTAGGHRHLDCVP